VSRDPRARLLAFALAALMGTPFGAAPVAGAPAAPGTGLAASAQAQVAAVPAAALSQVAAAPAPAPNADKPFFKTGKGALAAALLAGMLGYTVYSFSNDRVKSPAK
jgi:hypothetical protein